MGNPAKEEQNGGGSSAPPLDDEFLGNTSSSALLPPAVDNQLAPPPAYDLVGAPTSGLSLYNQPAFCTNAAVTGYPQIPVSSPVAYSSPVAPSPARAQRTVTTTTLQAPASMPGMKLAGTCDQPFVNVPVRGRDAVIARCPTCGHIACTRLKFEWGCSNFFCCVAICAISPCCICYPFFSDTFKTPVHYCRVCDANLSIG